MKVSCDIIKDLLPLYHDNICTDESRKIVEEHLTECSDCKGLLERIKDNTIYDNLKKERGNIVAHHAQVVKRKSLIVGISIASVMAVPVLVSLIVNLATGHALDWFFIVLTALMTLVSFTAVPLIFEKNKILWTLGSFTMSLTLLLLTCALYSGGDWFFVAIVPVLFGLSVLFAPFVIYQLPLKGFMASNKGLIVMIINTFLLYGIIIVSGIYGHDKGWTEYWRPALLITSVCSLLPWVLFLIIRYIKTNAFVKSGLCFIFSGLFFSMINSIIHWIVDGGVFRIQFMYDNLYVWNSVTVEANTSLLSLLTGCIIGSVLLIVGLMKRKHIK